MAVLGMYVDRYSLRERLKSHFGESSGYTYDQDNRGHFSTKQLIALAEIMVDFLEMIQLNNPLMDENALVEKVLELWIKRLVDNGSGPPST